MSFWGRYCTVPSTVVIAPGFSIKLDMNDIAIYRVGDIRQGSSRLDIVSYVDLGIRDIFLQRATRIVKTTKSF